MAEIKTRPGTPEYRENWDRIFGRESCIDVAHDGHVETEKTPDCEDPALADEFHTLTYEGAHA